MKNPFPDSPAPGGGILIYQSEDGRTLIQPRFQDETIRLSQALIAVGCRVRSHRGTQFGQWATARLSEYLVKGFTMDDEPLKQRGGGNCFEELLARIRDIRSSERVFWRKVLEIYATSIDCDPTTEASRQFFAASGPTPPSPRWYPIQAPEIVHGRLHFQAKDPSGSRRTASGRSDGVFLSDMA